MNKINEDMNTKTKTVVNNNHPIHQGLQTKLHTHEMTGVKISSKDGNNKTKFMEEVMKAIMNKKMIQKGEEMLKKNLMKNIGNNMNDNRKIYTNHEIKLRHNICTNLDANNNVIHHRNHSLCLRIQGIMVKDSHRLMLVSIKHTEKLLCMTIIL